MAYLAKFDPTLNDWRNTTNTMNTKHTPGPWKIEQGSNGDAVITHSDTELRSHVARIYAATLCPEHGTVEANARLIAAAPCLLEALQMLSETAGLVAQGAPVIDERGFNTLAHSISAALAAIDKATK
jgi:hypothetical protein